MRQNGFENKLISVTVLVKQGTSSIEHFHEQLVADLNKIGSKFEIFYIDSISQNETPSAVQGSQEHAVPTSRPTSLIGQAGGIARSGESTPSPAIPFTIYPNPEYRGQTLTQSISESLDQVMLLIGNTQQFPHDTIPAMIAQLRHADIVIANKKGFSSSRKKKINQAVFGLNCDTESEVKLCKKEVLDRLPVQEAADMLNRRHLINAKNAGFTIATVDTTLKTMSSLSVKRNVASMFRFIQEAIRVKCFRSESIPFHTTINEEFGPGFHYKGKAFVHYSKLAGDQTAFHRFSGKQIVLFTVLALLFGLSLLANWHLTIVLLLAFFTTLYFADLLFNLFLVYRSLSKNTELKITPKELEKIPEADWPSYTVFCPLYKEWQVLPQFITAMSRLDYPREKLQVMLLLEEDDTDSIAHIRSYNLPEYFTVVIVPNSLPKTKPKACNYGLTKATGEYAVIYDAEDMPEVDQLKKAVVAFRKADKNTRCIQAKLNFYNPHQNLLTRLFTAEYSLWFDLILTGLQSIKAPIPLGGTSNHFRTADLRELKGWDSFNVTEDCDLGIRLVKLGYTTAVINSITLEEANSDLRNWFWQRSRWIKGYMQTYFLHMRNPRAFLRNWTKPHVVTFQLIVGGKILSLFINPLMWTITIAYFALKSTIGPFVDTFFPMPVLYMGVISLLLGNFLYAYYYMVGSVKHGHHVLTKYGILVPFYWLAMSAAAWVAFYKFATAPHHWSKTKHGLHLAKNPVVDQVQTNSGIPLVGAQIVQPTMVAQKLSGISIILPAYNEEENLAPMAQRVDSFMKNMGIDYEIIIVNDGSTDGTRKTLDRLAQKYAAIVPLHLEKNTGYGAALRAGFGKASKEWLFFTDSDMQFDISELTLLIDKAQEKHVITGYRKHRKDHFMRSVNANLYKTALKTLFGLRVKDIDCAFKLFPKKLITDNRLGANGALINAELLVKAKRSGYKTVEVGVSHFPRTRGKPTGANPAVILRAMRELVVFRTTNAL